MLSVCNLNAASSTKAAQFQTRSPIANVPADLLLEIANHLDSRADILHFCYSSSRLYAVISTLLYAVVTLSSVDQCFNTLGMLARRPLIARHVRELIVRPKTRKWANSGEQASALVSATIRQLAASKRLEGLTTFAWDDDELPVHDDMWFALRVGCPQLKYISTTIGSNLPSVESHLFDFSDLRGFSLFLQAGFYTGNDMIFLEEDEPLYQKFKHMIMKRSPNLEQLAIDGVSIIPIDAHCILDGRWPNLKRLSIGDMLLDWPHNAEKCPFATFLEAHPMLRSLSMCRRNVDPSHLSSLNQDSFQLTSFSGTLQQLQAIPHVHPFLKSVAFREAMPTREVSALTVAGVLQGLSSLTKLKISFVLHSMYDSGNLLRTLVSTCPHLRHLELTCGHKPSFQLETFSKAIRGFPKLRSLHLTIVKYPGGETLSSGATRIAMTNPRLEHFSLTFLPPSYPLSIPFVFTVLSFPFRSRDTGTFSLTCDQHGLPIMLRAHERRRLFWPFGLGFSSRAKKYVSDLRPAGAPGRRQTGWKGVLNLVTDNSAAGEEMRMIVFSTFLLSLAMWGWVTATRRAVS